MITDVAGIRVGHFTDRDAATGCTVVLGDRPFVGSGEVRGSAPATREFSLLDPSATVGLVDAVVLCGGSAFGLAAADGVVSWLEDQDRGFPTPGGRVPIVVGMSLFDLTVGDGSVRPTATNGAAASASARPGDVELGSVGAGTGATVSKWRSGDEPVPGGLVSAAVTDGDLVVAALAAVNCFGDVVGSALAAEPQPSWVRPAPPADPGASADRGAPGDPGTSVGTNTTIGVVATNAAADKAVCHHMARGAHDGLARAVSPPHTSVDGDAFVALATGEVPAGQDQLRWMSVVAVEAAIRSAGALDVPR